MDFSVKTLEADGIEIYILTKYVDDVQLSCRNLHLRTKLDGGKLFRCEYEKKRHQEESMLRSQVTIKVVQDIANSFFKSIHFTGGASISQKQI